MAQGQAGASWPFVQQYAKNLLFLHTKYGNHSSFRLCNLRSKTAIRRSLRQRFLKQMYTYSNVTCAMQLCRVHCPTFKLAHKWTSLFRHRETPGETAWQQQDKDWPHFQSSEAILIPSSTRCKRHQAFSKCADQIETSTTLSSLGKPRTFNYFLCPGSGGFDRQGLPGVRNLAFDRVGWEKLNRKCKASNNFFFF